MEHTKTTKSGFIFCRHPVWLLVCDGCEMETGFEELDFVHLDFDTYFSVSGWVKDSEGDQFCSQACLEMYSVTVAGDDDDEF